MQIHKAQQRAFRLRLAQATLLLLLLFFTGGCRTSTKDAKVLVDEGKATSQTLAEFYSALATQEQARNESFVHKYALGNKGFTPEDEGFGAAYAGTVPIAQETATFKTGQEDVRATIAALQARAGVAQELNGLYAALGDLIQYDASGKVAKSANNLSKAIQELNHHPLKLTLPVNLGQQAEAGRLLDGAVKAYIKQKQLHEVRKNAPLIKAVLLGLAQLYNAEKREYSRLSEEYYKEARLTAIAHVSDDSAFLTARQQKLVDLFDLNFQAKPSTNAMTRQAEQTFALNDIARKSNRYIERSRQDTENLLTALAILKVDHDRFEQRKPLTVNNPDPEPDVRQLLDTLEHPTTLSSTPATF